MSASVMNTISGSNVNLLFVGNKHKLTLRNFRFVHDNSIRRETLLNMNDH